MNNLMKLKLYMFGFIPFAMISIISLTALNIIKAQSYKEPEKASTTISFFAATGLIALIISYVKCLKKKKILEAQ